MTPYHLNKSIKLKIDTKTFHELTLSFSAIPQQRSRNRKAKIVRSPQANNRLADFGEWKLDNEVHY